MNKLILTVIASVVLISSCKHEPINPNSNPTNSAVCNTDTAYFQNDVLPLFVSSCAKSGCHDATTKAEGLNLSNYNSIMATNEIKAGKPNDGDIMKEINRGSMPPSSPLSADQKALLSKWISQGAKNNGCTSSCDTLNVKYSVQVKTIIDANCKIDGFVDDNKTTKIEQSNFLKNKRLCVNKKENCSFVLPCLFGSCFFKIQNPKKQG
jgi:hypothetical protein